MLQLSEEQYKRQTDELQVLQSIFGDDIVFFKIINCWKVILNSSKLSF